MEFRKALKNTKNDAILEFFYRERLCKRLVLGLEDTVEKHREWCVEMISEMIEKFSIKEESQIILPAIANRMIKVPYAEQCKYI
tara:strand:- start:284 stop:535 length:252 start_codon:yes stop_codon:yes gene_type:complete